MSTLFHIDYDLAALYEEREEHMALVIVEAAGEDQRREAVRSIDFAISERLKDLDRKIDGIAYLCKEYAARSAAHKAEGKRLTDLAKHEEATAAEIKSRAAEVLAQRVKPEAIAAATQGSNLLKLTGQHNTISLRKSPPSVVVDDESLLPDDLRRIAVTFTVVEWMALRSLLDGDPRDPLRHRVFVADKVPPRLSEIAARLKERVPCGKCGGRGGLPDRVGSCPDCLGGGRVAATVPGARLIEDNVYLVVK